MKINTAFLRGLNEAMEYLENWQDLGYPSEAEAANVMARKLLEKLFAARSQQPDASAKEFAYLLGWLSALVE